MWWAEYSPDGHWIVSGGGDRTVRIWDAESGRLQQTLRSHPAAWALSAVHSTSCDPAGTRIASAGDASIQLWEAAGGEATAVLRGHRDWVRGVAFTPDGEHPIPPSGTGLTLWDLRQGVERQCRRKREDLGAAQW